MSLSVTDQKSNMNQSANPAALVDPFIGTEAKTFPKAEGFAGRWTWIKAEVGNAHPGACYPFGMVSVCPYSGAYVTGYGLYKMSTKGQPEKVFDEYTVTGFTHFQHSGTGAIGHYYNYLRVIPFSGSAGQIGERWNLKNESARPGYYSAELADTGIKAEITVERKCAVHRYTFPSSGTPNIAIDLSTGGLSAIGKYQGPSEAEAEAISDTEAQGRIVCTGLPIYFYVKIDAGDWGVSTFKDGKTSEGKSINNKVDGSEVLPYGLLFTNRASASAPVTVKIGFSLRSMEQAKQNVESTGEDSFDKIADDTYGEWNRYLSRISITGGSPDIRKIFYTSLYHSLIKPTDFTGENPRTKTDDPFFLDFVTMWDIYKTQLPLVLTVYPERGRDIVNSLLGIGETYGMLPAAVLLIGDISDGACYNQGRCLPHVTIAQAFAMGLSGIDWVRAQKVMQNDFACELASEFMDTGKTERMTHTLDYSYAAFCTAQIAEFNNDRKTCVEMMRLAERWRNVYDPATGVLLPGKYYEGGNWNYSFRFLHDMAGRIALCGSNEAFCEKMDMFFRITEPPADECVQSWEAMNNEPDMESPYVYIYAGRPDRTAEVVREAMKWQFDAGKGGIPGNDDSGGTSAWYVWSAIGLFPVAGQDIYLIGSPVFDKAEIELNGNKFIIEAKNASDENIYVQSASLNGKPLDRAYLRYSEFKDGANLIVEMGSAPSDWGRGGVEI